MGKDAKLDGGQLYRQAYAAGQKARLQPRNNSYESYELVGEMLKRIEKELDEICSQPYDQYPIYIQWIQLQDQCTPNMYKNRIFIRYSRPDPSPNTYLFSYSPQNSIKLEWCIPNDSIAEMIHTHPQKYSKFDPQYVEWIDNYMRERKKRVAALSG